MTDRLSFEAKDERISSILFSDYRYRVPRYQRPYSWEEDNIAEFWNDLMSSEESYFLGSFIFNFDTYNEDKSSGFVEIIDGQQRMLTITILLAAMRDIAHSIDKEVSKRIHRNAIVKEDLYGKHTTRIVCGDTTREFFEKFIQIYNPDSNKKDVATQSSEERLIKKNYEFLYNKIDQKIKDRETKEEKLRFINELNQKIASLIVVKMRIRNEDEAYEIFETTNARGVDLSIGDLLKNLILKKIKAKDDMDLAKEIWKDIINNVDQTDTELKKFVRYYWLSKRSHVPEKRLFKEIKNYISNWEDLLNELNNSSDWYNKLIVLNEKDWSDIKHGERIYSSLCAIKFMGVTQCYVLFLSILRNKDKINTDPAWIFELIEKFSFQYSAICKLPANKLEKIYSRYATEIERIAGDEFSKKTSGKIQSLFEHLKKDLLAEKPPFDFFKNKFSELEYRNSESSRQFIKYVLSKIESQYSTGEKEPDFNVVNVEHILPQNPNKEWSLRKKDIKTYVNKLGNLTLLHEKLNSKIGNKPIKDKIIHLRDSEFVITKKLVSTLEELGYVWNEDQINKRQDQFAEIAYNHIWSY